MLAAGFCLVASSHVHAADKEQPGITLEPPTKRSEIWQDSVGDGFLEGAQSITLKISRGFGVAGGGPKNAHDLWYLQGQFGTVLNDTWGKGHWYAGNLEFTGQLIAGLQDHPETAYFFGLNGGLRYQFATGGRLNPFIAGSFGIAATDIGEPDLSTIFEFNEQIGAGLRYYLNDHQAITFEYFVQHISNADIREPNGGVNAHFISLGFAWLF